MCLGAVQQCFEEIERPFDDLVGREKRVTRDDWVHGSLLVVNELLRCSNIEGEVRAVATARAWCVL